MSSSSSITTSTVNGTTRITGLSSGIDVDGIVEQLVTAEKAKKLNKLQQKLQTAEWKQTAYRDIITDVQDFSSEYFSTTSSSSIMKASNFLQYASTSSDSAVSVTAASTASARSHTVTVTQLATAATLTSSASVSKEVQGSAVADYTSLTDESFVMTLDGTDYTVDLDNVNGTTGTAAITALQTAIDTAVGSGKVTVSTNSSGYLEITSATNSGVQAITVSATDANSDGTADNAGLSELGFGTGAILSNRLDTSDTLATIAEQLSSSTASTFGTSGVSLTINGTTKSFASTVTLATMMSEINSADLGVTMTYDTITGKLVMTADDTGAGNTLTVTDTDSSTSNFATLLLTTATAGVDAKVTIDDQALTRSSNTITLDGVTYTLNAETTEEATVTVTQDTDGVYDLISAFVDDYNTLIDTINTAIDENADSDYPPLTDDEKEEMTDDEITAWETKAKVGLLESDSTLEALLSDLRTSLIDSVSGSTISLSSIGISSGTYDEDGALYIDEDTLTAAIASDPEAVMNLFTQKSSTYPNNSTVRSLSSSALSTRYEEEGISYRFYDTMQKYISTTRDSSGNKGTLLEKAGTEDDATDTDNTLTTLIDKYQEEIDDEEDRLDDLEDTLYDKYTTLETYISTMNSQLSALSSLTSS
ncbi:flagellar hook-associated 2 domain-containing protein [Pelosinus sp. UFO1]|nr:flagellar hook-associated 2 domain-containing protein [Pelosinus sp. UFO1]